MVATTFGASIQLPGGLPISYPQGADSVRMTIDGWFGTSQPRAELAPSIAGDGAAAIGPWDSAEAYYTLRGLFNNEDQAVLLSLRRQLLNALPATEEVPITVYTEAGEDRTAFVRLYDKPDITLAGPNLQFTMPLVAPDPYKYEAVPLSAQFGVFTGSNWYKAFNVNTTPNPDVYWLPFVLDTAPTPDRGYMTFTQQQSTSAYPPAAVLVSGGDVSSRRLAFDVTGPVTQGDWKIVNEATGDELWADTGLVAGQTIVFDCYTQTATMAGASVDSLVFGDWLTLEPGANTYRLVAGDPTAGFALVHDALPAYR